MFDCATTATFDPPTVGLCDPSTLSMRRPLRLGRRDPAFEIGDCVGAYHLIEHLGAGGICDIYRGRHVRRGYERAIKVLRPSARHNRQLAERLRLEAQIGMRFYHPNLVRVFEPGESPLGPFFAMELLEGATLAELLHHEQRLSPIRAADIVRQTAEGLATLHRAGFIHCDVKPANLMLSFSPSDPERRSLKIIDFGIAQQTRLRVETMRSDAIIGTPGYLAPEELTGAPFGPKVDLYALGVVLYRIISGRIPYEGTFEEIAAQQRTRSPGPLPVAEGLGPLAFRLLDKSPVERPSALEIIDAIDHLFPMLRP
jgi:serine/threonine-protein kinase